MAYVAKLNPGFTRAFAHFTLSGVSHPGKCDLRVTATNDAMVCMAVQLSNYSGISITNAIEDIRARIVALLVDESVKTSADGAPALMFIRTGGILQRIFTSKRAAEAQKRAAGRKALIDNMRIVEHYPSGTGLAPDGSYSLVTFGSGGDPEWTYMTKDAVASACRVPTAFFDYP
ncbi:MULTISPECIES: hypothetical protein [pseudomallei group]|uniref:hypothetical protein n=1 Tax=pseudomallei group TaxID=111527 RepID=UPI000536CEB1|nr:MULTISPECIES: hypothetical protein [pseudomallei group]KGW87908.1 hypothetical protein Y030_2036 [Burkholderia pseudomallei MSHR332]MCS3396903.1 hypothetical protein [Burkholderia thailandensis]MUV27186.1 hypothetical protein [Burkholderia thailandensis]QIO10866.1 hypothetical protein G9462_01960 [Burkholderia thailandensis]